MTTKQPQPPPDRVVCHVCGGTGSIDEAQCGMCCGSGETTITWLYRPLPPPTAAAHCRRSPHARC